MYCIEIILEDIKKKYLDEIIRKVLKPNNEDIISSHFFDKKSDKNIEFQDIGNFSDFFEIEGTGNLFLRATDIGTEIEKVFVIISCDGESADITINFDEEQFEKNNLEMKNKLQKLFSKLCEIQNKYFISAILVGYEPATDDDMKIAEFRCRQVTLYNEKSFLSQFARVSHDTLTQMFLL